MQAPGWLVPLVPSAQGAPEPPYARLEQPRSDDGVNEAPESSDFNVACGLVSDAGIYTSGSATGSLFPLGHSFTLLVWAPICGLPC